jgi:2-keto-3-deoxy-L-rhamnonate aldolase RhmA
VTRLGTVLSLPDPALAELAGAALDLAWIDLEHGALSVADVPPLAIALQAAGCAALVRLPAADSDRLAAVLDAGIDGAVAPGIESAAQARAFVRRLRYPPAGTRGFGPRRAGAYGRTPAFWESDAATVECVVQVESPAGLDAVEAIAAVAGVDAVVLGCSDLSLALGVPQDLDCAPMRSAAARVATAAEAAGVAFGVAASGDPSAVAALAAGRAELVVYGADVRLYAGAVDGAAAELADALGGARAAA